MTSPGGALSQGGAESPGSPFPGVSFGFERSLAFGGSRGAPVLWDLVWDHFPNLPAIFAHQEPDPGCAPRAGLRPPSGRCRASGRLLGVVEPRRLTKPAFRARGELCERQPQGKVGGLDGVEVGLIRIKL